MGLSSDPSHKKADGATPPPRGGAQFQPIYIQSVKVSDWSDQNPRTSQDRTLEKITRISKMLWGLSSDTSHRQTDESTSPPRGGVKLKPYIINLYRFQIDPTKTLVGVQDKTLEKITWIFQMLWGPKFRRLSQTNGQIDVTPKGRCKTPAHIFSICIGFRLIRPKPYDKWIFTSSTHKTCVGVHNSSLSWCWPQAPLELCLSSRLVCRSPAWPNHAQAVLG